MNFTFSSAQHGTCIVKLWATGRYGFSLPKRVDIATSAGAVHSYVYCNRQVQLKSEPSNRAIVRIAVARFLQGGDVGIVEIDADMPVYDGELTPTRMNAPRPPLRVRPGRSHGRIKPALGIGEAVVTVMNERGAPSPVAWTRLRAPQGSMSPTPADVMATAVSASPLLATYGTPIDRQSAYELLSVKMNAAAEAETNAERARAAKEAQADYDKAVRDMRKSEQASRPKTTTRTPARRAENNPLGDMLGSRTGQTIVREVLRGIFSTLKRK